MRFLTIRAPHRGLAADAISDDVSPREPAKQALVPLIHADRGHIRLAAFSDLGGRHD